MRARIQAVIDIVQAAFRSWSDHRAIRFGAGLAYYWLFAVVPLALLAIHLASAFFSVSDIASWLLEVANEISSDGLSMELREFLTAMITETQDTVFTWGAAIVAAVSASFAFAATQDALNMVWDSPKIHGFGHTLRRRLALFVAAVAVASLLIVALLVNAIVGAIEDLLPGRLLDQTIEVVSSFAVYAMIIGLTTLAYRYMPRPSVPWRPSLIAALLATVAFGLATWGYGLYIDNTRQATLAGAAGSVLATLVWMYVIAQVFVAGGEISRAIHEHRVASGAVEDVRSVADEEQEAIL